MSKVCAICQNQNDHSEFVQPRLIGIKTINQASKARGDKVKVHLGDNVHTVCRKHYIHKWYVDKSFQEQLENAHNRTRGSNPSFSCKTKCFFCGNNVTVRDKQSKCASEVLSKNRDIDKKVMEEVSNRGYDEWALVLLGRLEGICDLHAEDAVYHHQCYSNFVTRRNIPLKHQTSENSHGKRKRGRPKDELQEEIYNDICKEMLEMEKNDENITVPLLVKKMSELASDQGVKPYDIRYLKKRIEKDFDGKIIISNINGNADVITFKTTVSKILQNFQKTASSNDDEIEKLRIIKTAADIIKNDIKQMNSNLTFYPTVEDIENSNNFSPQTLLYFLQNLISCKNSSLITSSISQAIIQNVRPQTIITPIQLSIGVILHRHFESKYLIDLLNKFGLCASYSEVLKFESCAANQSSTEIHNVNETSFLHFVADNVDHNTATIDGLNTFHGMGIIACVTNPSKNRLPPIKRTVTSNSDILEISRIERKYFTLSKDLKPFKYFRKVSSNIALDNTKLLGYL